MAKGGTVEVGNETQTTRTLVSQSMKRSRTSETRYRKNVVHCYSSRRLVEVTDITVLLELQLDNARVKYSTILQQSYSTKRSYFKGQRKELEHYVCADALFKR